MIVGLFCRDGIGKEGYFDLNGYLCFLLTNLIFMKSFIEKVIALRASLFIVCAFMFSHHTVIAQDKPVVNTALKDTVVVIVENRELDANLAEELPIDDVIKQGKMVIKGDSVAVPLRNTSDTLLSVIAGNTITPKILNIDIEKGNFHIGLWALVFGGLGTWFGLLAYRFSKKTADNVVRMSADNQIALFNDMIRHLYRNLVCTLTIGRIQEERKEHNGYPSEEHLLKLKMLPEDIIHLEKYNDNKVIYTKMHELKLLFRNYDTEIDVCMMHYKNLALDVKEVEKDLSVLMFKPFYLMTRIVEIEYEIYKNEQERTDRIWYNVLLHKLGLKNNEVVTSQSVDAADVMLSEHLSKLTENNAADRWIGNYTFVDYCNSTEKPQSDCSRGFEKFRDKLLKDTKGQGIQRSLEWLVSDANENMVKEKKEKVQKKDIFDSLRSKDALKDYIKELDKQQISFLDVIPYALSVDVAIEKNKIRFIDMKKES